MRWAAASAERPPSHAGERGAARPARHRARRCPGGVVGAARWRIDPGETYLNAAIRELREETGIVVEPDQVGAPTGRRRTSFVHRGVRRVQDEVIVPVLVDGAGPMVDESGRLHHEKEDYFDFRCWPVTEVAGSTERFYPGRLPELLPAFLAGEQIDEPLEVWSCPALAGEGCTTRPLSKVSEHATSRSARA